MDPVNKCSMLYWYPLVKDLVPCPATEIVDTGDWRVLCGVIDGDPEKKFEPYVPRLIAAADRIGYPLFMRTDLSSAKHEWLETCYIPDQEHLLGNLGRLLDITFSCDLDSRALVLRKYIKMDFLFRAFRGMPVAREFRFFVRDGKVECYHFYWPADSIEFYGQTQEPIDWKNRLDLTNRLTPSERRDLYFLAGRIAQVLPGYWSLDFCCGADGQWWFIDAALGDLSYHTPGCKYNKNDQG